MENFLAGRNARPFFMGAIALASNARLSATAHDDAAPQRSLPPCGGGTGRGVATNARVSFTPLPNPPPQGGREREPVPSSLRSTSTPQANHRHDGHHHQSEPHMPVLKNPRREKFCS